MANLIGNLFLKLQCQYRSMYVVLSLFLFIVVVQVFGAYLGGALCLLLASIIFRFFFLRPLYRSIQIYTSACLFLSAQPSIASCRMFDFIYKHTVFSHLLDRERKKLKFMWPVHVRNKQLIARTHREKKIDRIWSGTFR